MGAIELRQQAFIEEYVIDFSVSAAAKRAGIAAGTAHRLMRRPEVQARIAEILGGMANERRYRAEWVADRLLSIATADVRKLYHEDGRVRLPHELDDEIAGAVQSVEMSEAGYKYKLADKLKAQELLGRYLSMFTERVEVDIGSNLADALKQARARASQHTETRGTGGGMDPAMVERVTFPAARLP